MVGPTPLVRQLIVCDRLTVDRDSVYTLIGPRVDLIGRPGESFPIVWPELWVFAQVTGSYGRHQFRLRVHDVTDPTTPPELAIEEPPRAIDLGPPYGPHRLRSRGWSVKLRDLDFLSPGRYELSMTFDGGTPAVVELLVEEQV